MFHSTFELGVCLSVCLSEPHLSLLYFLLYTSLSLPPTAHHAHSLNTTSPATFHHLLPLWSVSLPQDLSSDWDGMFQGYTLPSANEFLNQFMEPPPPAPLPPSLSVSPPSLHLLLSLPPWRLSLLRLESYLFPLSAGMNLRPAPPSILLLLPLFLSRLCKAQLSPLPLFPFSPNPTCSHSCVAPIYGFITAAIHGWRKERGDQGDTRGRDMGYEERREKRKTHDKDLLNRKGQ